MLVAYCSLCDCFLLFMKLKQSYKPYIDLS